MRSDVGKCLYIFFGIPRGIMAGSPSASTSAASLTEAFDIYGQQTEIETLVLHATSLEVARRLILSTTPRYVRALKVHEADAIYHLLRDIKERGGPNTCVDKDSISRSIYLGRVRRNRLRNEKYSDEPCLYLVFPHLPEKHDIFVKMLTEQIIIPSFSKALDEYELPRLPRGAKRPVPILQVQDRHRETDYNVYADLFEDWNITAQHPHNEQLDAARKEIHRLAWKYMNQKINGPEDAQLGYFRDMSIMVVVPEIGHVVGTDIGPRYNQGMDPAHAVMEEVLGFYDGDLDGQFLGDGKAVYRGDYSLVKNSGHGWAGSADYSGIRASLRSLAKDW